MKYENRYYYRRSPACRAMLDEEMSTPAREITEEQAKAFMNLFSAMGLKKHETAKQIFFSKIIDYNHFEEYIFYK